MPSPLLTLYSPPSVFLNSFPQNSFPSGYPTEAAGKDAEEGGHDEERGEEGRQEEEEEEEKKVDLSQPSASLLPDLLEFERCAQWGGMVYSHRGILWGRGQAPASLCGGLQVCTIQTQVPNHQTTGSPCGKHLNGD